MCVYERECEGGMRATVSGIAHSPIVVVITKVVIGNRIGWVISSLFDKLSEW